MPPHPFTHHEIFALVGPFSRGGHHVDMAATDRLERRLVFKSRDRSADAPEMGGLRETLELRSTESGTLRLSRSLLGDDGLIAKLEMEGTDPAQLLRCIDSIPPQRQFEAGIGYLAACDYELAAAETGTRHDDASAATGPGVADGNALAATGPGVRHDDALAAARTGTAAQDPPRTAMIWRRGFARVRGMTLEIRVPTVRGEPAEIVLATEAAQPLSLPRDLLAVLGWDWSTLSESGTGWRGKLRFAGREPARSLRAERQFERAVLHLAATLAEAPGRFHARWAAARWRVYARCATPLAVCVALIAAAAAVPRAHLTEHSALRMLIFNMPPLLMGLYFCLREIPRIEIPPLPRPLRVSAWPFPSTTSSTTPNPGITPNRGTTPNPGTASNRGTVSNPGATPNPG